MWRGLGLAYRSSLMNPYRDKNVNNNNNLRFTCSFMTSDSLAGVSLAWLSLKTGGRREQLAWLCQVTSASAFLFMYVFNKQDTMC